VTRSLPSPCTNCKTVVVPARVSTESPAVREPLMQPEPLTDGGTKTASTPSRTLGHPEPERSWTPNQNRRPVESGRTSGNRVLNELQTLDERFKNLRCSKCGGGAQLTLNNEGLVVMCTRGQCRKVERVDVQTLQSLAERLHLTCYQCRGTNLESQTGRFSNYLKCRDDGANNSWQGISERLGMQ
jgi:hypothetical protein